MLKRIAPTILLLILAVSMFTVINSTTSLAATTGPAKLKIYTGPTSVLADNNTYNCIFVQLQDSTGKPARALQDTTISLSSSQTNIGTVDSSIIIHKDSTYASASFTSTFSPGTTAISASATGYATVQASMTTVGPIPSTVALYGFPSTLPANGSFDAIMVQLQDTSGTPAKAPKDGVVVSLASSNSAIAEVSPSVTIPEGKTYAIATFNTTTAAQDQGKILTVVVTSVAQGYTSQQVTMTVTPTATNPTQLKIFAGPTKIPADQSSYKQIAIELQNATGFVGVFSSDVLVTLGSSDPSIGEIDSQITIPQGQTYTLATLNTTYRAGSTTITAVATNLLRSQQTITTTGFTPSKLAVYCVPSTLPSDKGTYQAVQVQLQDSQGHPAKDPQADVEVNLFSAQPTVGTVSSTLTIPFGQTQATGSITVTNTAGSTAITAQASSYTTGQATLTTYTIDFLPMQITATPDSSTISNGQKINITVYLTVNSAAVTGATVQFTSDNGGTFTKTADQGDGHYVTTFTAPSFTKATTCTITATATKTGYVTSQTTTPITVQPLSTSNPTASSSPNATSTNSTGTIQLQIENLNGSPLSGATVTSTFQPNGTLTLLGTTNETGYVVFKNVTTGQYTFSVSKDGYKQLSTSINLKSQTANTTLMLPVSTSAGNDSTLLIVVVAIAVIVPVVVVTLLLLRRRRSKINQRFGKLPPSKYSKFQIK